MVLASDLSPLSSGIGSSGAAGRAVLIIAKEKDPDHRKPALPPEIHSATVQPSSMTLRPPLASEGVRYQLSNAAQAQTDPSTLPKQKSAWAREMVFAAGLNGSVMPHAIRPSA